MKLKLTAELSIESGESGRFPSEESPPSLPVLPVGLMAGPG